jgi:predicted phosphodiesterase
MRIESFVLSAGALVCACGTSQQGNLESDQHDQVADPVAKAPFNADLTAACGAGRVTSDGANAMVRWPYLQKMTDHGVTIMWTNITDVPAASIEVTSPDGEVVATRVAEIDTQSRRPAFTQYATEIDGLEPDTVYCYRIAGSADWLTPTGFRTAPERGSDAPIRAIVIGDLGSQSPDQFAVREQMMQVPFDLVLVVGDLAYESGTLSDHERNFFEVYRELLISKPFFVISGNHDYASDGAVFREVFGLFENGGSGGRERWYSFDWGPLHLTAIDTEALGDDQATWVANDLQSTDQLHKIAFMHKPAFSSGTHGSSGEIQRLFVANFVANDVELVLAGHDHDYERTEPIDGVTYVVTGAAGRGTRPVGASSFTAYSEEVAHFTYLDIDGDALRLNAIDGMGGDFDTVTIAP